MDNTGNKKKVCIVGGGAFGLGTLRRVLDSPGLTGTVFEQKDDVGGLWYFNGKTFKTSPKNMNPSMTPDMDPECVTTMYSNLNGNLPHPVMKLDDFKHCSTKGTFPTLHEMHTYFREYCTHFNLWPHIQVNTAIVNIRPENPNLLEGAPVRWIVETHNHKDDVYSTAIFDAVIICTGKNTYPYEPKIPGMDDFKGEVMHFKYFKDPEEFRGKNVVCIGLGPSSADVALIVAKVAKKVTVCHKFPAGFKLGLLPPNATETKSVKAVTKDAVITEEDEVIPCDTILLCTGYGLKFPFLHPECGLEVKDEKYIPHLYKMTVFTKRPTLAIFNMVYRVPEIVIAEIQARWYINILEGKIQLPSYEEMEAELKADELAKEEQGIPLSLWFQIGDMGMEYWPFFQKLANDAGITEDYKHFPLLSYVYGHVVGRIFGKMMLHRQDTLNVISDTKWEINLGSLPEYPDSKPGKITITLNPDSTLTVDTIEY